ncbi:MAG: antitoxin [Nitriliruptorales bacterium]|nr:antitoxin [Nitriliruptorales bacterium]
MGVQDDLKNNAEEARAKAEELAREARERIEEITREARERIDEVAGELRERVAELAGGQGEKVREGIEKAAGFIDEKTQRRFSEQIKRIEDAARGLMDRLAGDGADASTTASADDASEEGDAGEEE